MADTSIEWSEKVWNPTRGCDIYSKECLNCYAMRQAHRFSGPGGRYEGLTQLTKAGPVWTGEVRPIERQLEAPLAWRDPRLVFVDSMSDLFYGDEADEKRARARRAPFRPVPMVFIDRVFKVMERCPQHTFQLLTKRPARMLRYLLTRSGPPLPHVLTGCSVGFQDAADQRLDPMRAIAELGWRAWVSYEPAIGPVNWDGWDFIRWLVAGEESGYGRRRADVQWFRLTAQWCAHHGVAFFMKQLLDARGRKIPFDTFPGDLQVRAYPL